MKEIMNNTNNTQTIDLRQMFRQLWGNRKSFYKVWAWTFVLSCIWILPQPRYYISDVKLAPEVGGEDAAGSLSALASSFGINIGGSAGTDAIYPMLYPELFESPEFIVGLYGITVTTKDGSLTTDYYNYMKKHQKKNILTFPFRWMKKTVTGLFETEDTTSLAEGGGEVNPFMMSRKDYNLMLNVIGNINCSVDNKDNIITIRVKDQDPLVCATMADSVKQHLQAFIIRYRTSKAAEDVLHYQLMRDRARIEYDSVIRVYDRYCESHHNATMQSSISERAKLEEVLALKRNMLSVMETQLQTAEAKLQEKTPAFTTLKSTTVPVKPAGPKRMLFVICMLFLATLVLSVRILRRDLKKFFVIDIAN